MFKNVAQPCLKIPALALLATVLVSATASAVEPPVNTGGTSFMDGFGDPRGSGFAYHQYARFSSAGSVKDVEGNDIPAFQNPRLNVFADLNQFIYTFNTEVVGAHPGVYTIIPIVALDASFGAGGAALEDNGFGLGDMVFGTYLQFNPLMSDHGPVFAHRLDFGFIAPTGKYDSDKQINPGMNTWSLNPSWAATLIPVPGFELSTRVNYLYNFENSDPGGGSRSTKAGQVVFDNFALAYEFMPFNPDRTAAHSLRAGVNGYYFKQITDNEADGVKQADSREQVLGVGPGMMWIPTQDDAFWLNVYLETAVQNRFAANVFQARWARTF